MKRRRPPFLQDRLSCDEDEFVAWHFPSGPQRDAARRLWRLLEDRLNVDLRGLHPDDDLAPIVAVSDMDSLDTEEWVIAVNEELGISSASGEATLGSFRDYVDRLARGAAGTGGTRV